MIKRLFGVLIILLFCILLTGCWNYRGIDELALVAGMAIDKDFETNTYLLTFEIVDLSVSIKDSGMDSTYVEAEGKTILEGIRNAKKRLYNKLYFGNANVAIISEAVAREEGIRNIIDVFLRDAEFRVTLSVLVSQESTAKEVLLVKGTDHKIISHELQEILEQDHKVTGSTRNMHVFEIYNTLRSPGISLVLPACRLVTNGDQKTTEVNGLAIFHDDRLAGYLTPEETQAYLFAVGEIQGGILAVSLTEEKNYETSFEITKNLTKVTTKVKDGQIIITIYLKTIVFIPEFRGEFDFIEKDSVHAVEMAVASHLKTRIESLVKKMQGNEPMEDIFGFGNHISKKDPRLWQEIEDNWGEVFKTLEVEVKPQIEILSTGFMKRS